MITQAGAIVSSRAYLRRPDFLGPLALGLRENLSGLLGEDAGPDHYVVVDLKFTTKIDENSKAKDRQSYAAQVHLYSCVLELPQRRDSESHFANYARSPGRIRSLFESQRPLGWGARSQPGHATRSRGRDQGQRHTHYLPSAQPDQSLRTTTVPTSACLRPNR